jgi:glycosyltransferase involved in cell wall biosynthesis
MKVSVIIPSFNSMAYLPDTLSSVLEQTFTDFEVLIIDDGSSDNIVQWASEITDPRVKLISQKNQGASAARNTGITQSQAEYIAFLDADDLWAPTKLEKQVRYLDDNPSIGVVHAWMFFVDKDGNSTGRVIPSSSEGMIWKQLLEKNTIACLTVMVRRCCFDKAGLFDCSLRSVEDWDMWIRIAIHYPFAVIEEPLAYYRQRPNSKSRNCQAAEKAFHAVIEKAFEHVSLEVLPLKDRSYGHANLCLAWKALQSANTDYKLSLHYRALAISSYPKLRSSREYLRLSLAINTLKLLGPNNYKRLLNQVYALRRTLMPPVATKELAGSND